MAAELDPNTIATTLIKDIAGALLQNGRAKITDHLARYSAAFSKDFQKYYAMSFQKYSQIKTMLNREKPVLIESQYVKARFRYGIKAIKEDDIASIRQTTPKLAIMGTAGSGKSVFLKHYFLEQLKDPKGRLPVFIELRHLDLSVDSEISHWILTSLKDNISYVNDELVESFLENNKITLLLDGYDEIDFEHRQAFEKRLLEFCQKYPHVHLVLTTRPEETLYAWESIHVLEILPLTRDDAIALIKKFEYPDEDIKEKFAKAVERKLYSSHKSFIGNPLLLSMLLLTYEQFAEIPDKLHIFYEQAFEALYQKHDALKKQYKRRMYSNLALDEFRRILSALSYFSYQNSETSFSKAKIVVYIKKSLKYENIDQSTEKVFNDLMESICMLQKDGLYIVFSHKSFQDYFATVFISRSIYIDLEKTVAQLGIRAISDNIVPMLVSMHPEKLEAEYVIPTLKKMIRIIDDLPEATFYYSFLNTFTQGVRAERGMRY